MICLSVGNVNFDLAIHSLSNVDMAEIRMDLLSFTREQFISIFNRNIDLIVTCRSGCCSGNAVDYYQLAINAGCAYIDVDYQEVFLPQVVTMAKNKKCKIILSYHNFNFTPPNDVLEAKIQHISNLGADIVKLACMANSANDCSRILDLYKNHSNLVAFCMGELGIQTRLLAPTLGAPFTYAAIEGHATAKGQLTVTQMRKYYTDINFNFK